MVLIVLVLVAAMMPIAIHMGMNQSKDDNETVIHSLMYQQDQDRRASAVKVDAAADIEVIWELEDMRTESADLLVQTMYCGDYELGFDAASSTFYCSVGMDGEDWPEMTMYAAGEENLRVVWVDDYAYDYRSDAVREGYSYELFAYTGNEYSYFNLVFTGLPIVTLHVKDCVEVGDEYVPTRATVFGQGYDAINSAALVHKRGAGYKKPIDKTSYRVEFHAQNGTGIDKRNKLSVLGMEADSDWLLLSNAQESTAVRNYLAFDMWNRWNPDGALTNLDNRMVELFINDEYTGLYQLMERVSPEREILRAGGNPSTDCAVKLVAEKNRSEKPIINLWKRAHYYVEYQYEPHGDAERLFDILENYVILSEKPEQQPDDALFAELAQKHLDVDNIIPFFLFLQSCLLVHDNVYNNLYIWMFWEDGRYVYRLSPWDMDGALYVAGFEEDGKLRQHFDLNLTAAVRMLDLNLMNSRKKLHALWHEMRGTLLTDDALYDWIISVEEKINASGAYLRESEKWYGEATELNLSELLYCVTEHMNTIDANLNQRWPLEE